MTGPFKLTLQRFKIEDKLAAQSIYPATRMSNNEVESKSALLDVIPDCLTGIKNDLVEVIIEFPFPGIFTKCIASIGDYIIAIVTILRFLRK